MRFSAVLLFTLVCMAFFNGQDSEKKSWKENVFIGGNLGFNFGRVTYIDVSPLVGYRFTERYSGGITLGYQYFNDKNIEVSGDVISYGVFNRLNVTDELFLYGEFQNSSYSGIASSFGGDRNLRTRVPFMWLGAGYSQRIGGVSSLFVSFLYDVIQNPNGRFQNPQIRAGVTVGI